MVFTAQGCSSPVGISADATHSTKSQFPGSRTSTSVFDAGILFANETNYVCIPFGGLSIDPTQEITSIKSSCECVRPSVVRYVQRQSQEGVALRLDFVDDSKGPDETSPQSLAVEIQFEFASGAKQFVTIQFLLTTQIGKSIVMRDADCDWSLGEVASVPTGSIGVGFWGMASQGNSSFFKLRE